MTPIADMVERMLAAGEPASAIVEAARSMEDVTRITPVTHDVTLPSRVTAKEKNRLRQAKHREKLRLLRLAAEAEANDAARGAIDRNASVTRDSVTPPCDLLSIQGRGLSVETKKVRKKEETENARATRMQPGALLTEPLRQAAIELGARPEDIPGAWAEFVDFWIGVPGSRGTKLNWPATWRNRVRTILARGKGSTNGRRTVHDAAKDLLAKVRAFDAEPPRGICDGAGEPPVRLLSSR